MAATVCAVVVTHDRRELLERCLSHLEAQTRAPERVLVVDNASSDGTAEMLAGREGIEVLRLPDNAGSAGGFASGLEWACSAGCDWIWLMDDDTFAEERALDELVVGAERAPRRPAVMASVVRWRDGRLHPMNRPWLRLPPRGEFAQAAGVGLAPIRAATWVSTLVRSDAVVEHGLPRSHYFVWLDDIEYTARLLRDANGYLAPESGVVHWTPRASDTLSDTRGRFYFKVRNHLWLLRGSSFTGLERVRYSRAWIKAIAAYLRQSSPRPQALRTVLRGLRDGMRREPCG